MINYVRTQNAHTAERNDGTPPTVTIAASAKRVTIIRIACYQRTFSNYIFDEEFNCRKGDGGVAQLYSKAKVIGL